MPWLTGTAFLHSLMIQEKRGMLKVWNVSLVLGTGTLAIMGTFLVRSGILDSIHAFGGHTLGVPFVCLIGLMIAGSIYLVVSRRSLLRSEHRLDSLISRESMFMANNIVLVGLCFVIFWGTYFPLISEALTGQESSVGPPWFDRYTVPLALILVLLSGIGPVIAWRRATLANARRNFLGAGGGALLTLAVLLLAGVTQKPLAIAMFCCAAFVLGSVGQEFFRGTRARRAMAGEPGPLALLALVRRNRRRYGGYVVHIGIAVLFVGVAASSSFQHTSELSLSPGQSTRVGAYTVRYVRPTATLTPRYDTAHTGSTLNLGAVLDVTKNGAHVADARPQRGVLFLRRSRPGLGRQPDRRSARQPRGHGRRHYAQHLDGDPARHRNPRAEADRDGRRSHAAARRGDHRDRLSGARVSEEPAAGPVQPDRLADGDVDLDRRADRLRWRADRAVARSERRTPPRVGAGAGRS